MGSGVGSSGVLLAGAVVALGALVGLQAWWRGWWRQGTARAARLVEAEVKPRLLPPRRVDLLGLQRRLVATGLTAVTVSVTGEQRLPARIPIEVSAADLRRLATQLDGGLAVVCADVAAEIARRGDGLGYTTPADLAVEVIGSPFAVDGRPRLARTGERRSDGPAAPAPGPVPDLRTARLDRTALTATRRWVGDRTVNLDRASLVPADGGPPRPIGGRRTTVGRRDADLVIDHPSVSARHAELVCERGRWSVVDRQSTNGTWVNGDRVSRRALADGDRVQFAPDGPAFVFRLRPAVPGPEPSPATARANGTGSTAGVGGTSAVLGGR